MLHGLAGDVQEPTHLPKRVGHVVPGVVVYLSIYGSGEIQNALIAAAWGALYKLTSDLTSPNRKICKIGPEKPQGECPVTFIVFNVLIVHLHPDFV